MKEHVQSFDVESPQKPEVLHSGNFDIILSPLAGEELKLELPGIMEFLDKYGSDTHLFFYPNPDNPKYFIKKRTNVRAVEIEHMKTHPEEVYNKKTSYAMNSLMNECLMSDKVTKVLAMEDMQQIGKTFGINEIRFLPQKVGLVQKQETNKFGVYDYQPGKSGLTAAGLQSEDAMQFVREMKKNFELNGITAKDLTDAQFIVDPNDASIIYLIDIEGYHTL